MSNLTGIEKMKLEKMFSMGSGYVLNFSNDSFRDFVYEHLRIDIYDDDYNRNSGSKANRLRAFWEKGTNHDVGKLTVAMLERWRTTKLLGEQEIAANEQVIYDECMAVTVRLREGDVGEHIDAIKPNVEDGDFALLAETIRNQIKSDQPQTALDRLHTFLFKFTRQLCLKHGIDVSVDAPLHSVFGMYVRFVRDNKLVESEMTERILKTSISILDSFNDVRNNKSFAHDNPILNYNESMLVFKTISAIIAFLSKIDPINNESAESLDTENLDELPF